MASIAEELYSLLVPLAADRLIVPRSCVAEVIRFSAIGDDAPTEGWLRGMTKWNNLEIPVLCLESMYGREVPATSGRTRVVVFHPIGGNAGTHAYGVLSEGFPQMVKLNREVVVYDESYRVPEHAPYICRISMLKEYALIPDLELVEQRLAAELTATQ